MLSNQQIENIQNNYFQFQQTLWLKLIEDFINASEKEVKLLKNCLLRLNAFLFPTKIFYGGMQNNEVLEKRYKNFLSEIEKKHEFVKDFFQECKSINPLVELQWTFAQHIKFEEMAGKYILNAFESINRPENIAGVLNVFFQSNYVKLVPKEDLRELMKLFLKSEVLMDSLEQRKIEAGVLYLEPSVSSLVMDLPVFFINQDICYNIETYLQVKDELTLLKNADKDNIVSLNKLEEAINIFWSKKLGISQLEKKIKLNKKNILPKNIEDAAVELVRTILFTKKKVKPILIKEPEILSEKQAQLEIFSEIKPVFRWERDFLQKIENKYEIPIVLNFDSKFFISDSLPIIINFQKNTLNGKNLQVSEDILLTCIATGNYSCEMSVWIKKELAKNTDMLNDIACFVTTEMQNFLDQYGISASFELTQTLNDVLKIMRGSELKSSLNQKKSKTIQKI